MPIMTPKSSWYTLALCVLVFVCLACAVGEAVEDKEVDDFAAKNDDFVEIRGIGDASNTQNFDALWNENEKNVLKDESEDEKVKEDDDDKKTKTPLYVVEMHHETMKYWLRAATEGKLPKTGLTLIHFDSHPDMGVPDKIYEAGFPWEEMEKAVSGDDEDDKNGDKPKSKFNMEIALNLERKNNIATHCIACVWADMVDRVIWIRPEWSNQMPDSGEDVYIAVGQDMRPEVKSNDEKWVMNSTMPYWLGNSNMNTSQFEDMRVFKLRVISGKDLATGKVRIDLPKDTPVILDIDLDYFSTRNPEFDRLSREIGEGNTLKIVKAFGLDEQLQRRVVCMGNDPFEREQSMKAVKVRWQATAAEIKSKIKEGKFTRRMLVRESLRTMAPLYCNQTRFMEGSEVLINVLSSLGPKKFREIGTPKGLMDLIEHLGGAAVVPHAPESAEPDRVKIALEESEKILRSMWGEGESEGYLPRPSVITVARSVGDGFLPSDVWPEVERETMDILHRIFDAESDTFDVEYDSVRDMKPIPKEVFESEVERARYLTNMKRTYDNQQLIGGMDPLTGMWGSSSDSDTSDDEQDHGKDKPKRKLTDSRSKDQSLDGVLSNMFKVGDNGSDSDSDDSGSSSGSESDGGSNYSGNDSE